MAKKICLDAGHYNGYNKYPPFPNYSEGNQMWTLTNKLKACLEKQGFVVITTRKNLNQDLGLSSRGATAKGCDMFISMHSNAVSSKVNDNVTGVETYYSIFDTKEGKDFATKITDAVAKVMNTKVRGAKTRQGTKGVYDYYSVMKGAVDAGCKHAFLIEHGFHTSTKDASFLIKAENLDKIAEAECKIICDFFDVTYKRDEPVKAEPVKKEPTHKGTAYKLTCKMLKVRKKASTLSAKVGEYHYGETFYVVGWNGNWCQLESGNWMCAKKYCQKV